MFDRNKLIIEMLSTAQNLSIYDEITPSIADNFISKYSKAKAINKDIAEVILLRYTCILKTANDFLKSYNNTLNLLL